MKTKEKRFIIKNGELVTCAILETGIVPGAKIATHAMRNDTTKRTFRCSMDYIKAETPLAA